MILTNNNEKPSIILDLDQTLISGEATENYDFNKNKKKAKKFKWILFLNKVMLQKNKFNSTFFFSSFKCTFDLTMKNKSEIKNIDTALSELI